MGFSYIIVTFILLCSGDETQAETDGFKNNVNNPMWGMADSRLLRKSHASYSDNAYQMHDSDRPSPMEISASVHMGTSGDPSEFSRNAMQAFYAQLVFDEMVNVHNPGCPPEYENMDIPSNHPLSTVTDRPQVFVRSMYDQSSGYTSAGPRQHLNHVSSYLDGGVIYGTSRVWTNLLRSFQDGRLLADTDDFTQTFPVKNDVKLPLVNAPVPKDHELKSVQRLFRLGNPVGHENPFLLSLQIIWFRWHNKVAEIISQTGGNMTDEQIFHAARRRVIAHFQKITWTEWLPHFLFGDKANTSSDTTLPPYTGYDNNVHPGISHEFMVAMGFRYSITPSAVNTLGRNGIGQCYNTTTEGHGPNGEARNVTSVRLCNNFWDSQNEIKSNFDDIVRGMLYTLSEKEDEKLVSDFTQHFHGPYEYTRTDHMANLLQRYRDHGVPTLNDVRSAFDLPTLDGWNRLHGTNGTIQQLYGGITPHNVDLLTGGLSDQYKVAGLSDVFRTTILDQFVRVRDGDRYWYHNKDNGLFNDAELQLIETTTFADILKATTTLEDNELLANSFLCQNPGSNCYCHNPPSTDDTSQPTVDVCTPLATHDYVSNSKWSFALSFAFVGLVPVVAMLVLYSLTRRIKNQRESENKKKSVRFSKNNQHGFQAKEWLGTKSGYRKVKGEFQTQNKRIVLTNKQEKYLRYLELVAVEGNVVVRTSSDRDMVVIGIRVPGDTDLVLQFNDYSDREGFAKLLHTFLTTIGIEMTTQLMSESELYKTSLDKDQRQELLDTFFRVVCQQAMEGSSTSGDKMATSSVREIMKIRLTINELAEAMGMLPSSLFVTNIFLMADKQKDRRITFREFREVFAVFLKGNADEKAGLLFKINDMDQKGYMTEEDFKHMIKSLLELTDGTAISDSDLNDLCKSMFTHVGLEPGSKMRLNEFKKVFCTEEYASTLQNATISGQATKQSNMVKKQNLENNKNNNTGIAHRRRTLVKSYRLHPRQANGNRQLKNHNRFAQTKETIEEESAEAIYQPARGSIIKVPVTRNEEPQSYLGHQWFMLCRAINRYKWHIFWTTLYTLVTIGIFVERAYYYAKGREHTGLRRMSGPVISAAIRGSASVIMFTYVSLLLTMCRNIITVLRQSFLHRFVPFDSAVSFHKYIAVLAMIATIIHIVGHAINLYNMSTQAPSSLDCFFREFCRDSDVLPSFHYWLFQTITGLAGVLVTILIFVMYVFASQYARRYVFKSFWMTHSLYWLVYLLTLLHGLGRLVQAPLFPWYLIGPLVIFVLDRLKSVSRKKVEIAVMSATPLPSGVLRLVFKRPANFTYLSGQWVRIACLSLSPSEYHPFTLTSAPHEPTLSLHIRAVGPWTKALRKTYSAQDETTPLPNIYIDGPFGEGHQDWYTFDVSILVGGGIGVTPFASILKDIAFKSRIGQHVACKKVYFIWVTRTQKSFEWLVDILRDVEAADTQELVSTHIFVTQYPEKYDLRTTMLYICERHFQKLEGKSLFTGLKATTHFGRPKFDEFFTAVTQEFKEISQVGVFSCGPGAMTSSVQKACSNINSVVGPTFSHHFENF